jgi:hypothetical protein
MYDANAISTILSLYTCSCSWRRTMCMEESYSISGHSKTLNYQVLYANQINFTNDL